MTTHVAERLSASDHIFNASLSPQDFATMLSLACSWAYEHERLILERGVVLTTDQMTNARRIGVAHPERVRMLKVERIPFPEAPAMVAVAQAAGLLTSDTAGLTLYYGIYIRSDCWDMGSLVVHELAHVSQYEQFGGLVPFLREYLWQCLTVGYQEIPMEQEARLAARHSCTKI